PERLLTGRLRPPRPGLRFGAHPPRPVDLSDAVHLDAIEVPRHIGGRPDPDEDVAVSVVPLNLDAHRRGKAAAGRERFAQIERLQHERMPAAEATRLRE